ncbi:enoyl-CoA hydratase/isomerase family protein [Actinomadura darangshiensis]|uniref:Enoyl-CoA hydratase/isomerase family protein n=2 Tax=Actinomadura darangshiensis TaxID=705336 RepID=A0A4R5BLT8_9ACTN|nr:enoyl-CoA hydratase/isomerase family protein [Actinomadura darangshiensis]
MSPAELAEASHVPLFGEDGSVRDPLVAVELGGDADGVTVERAVRHARAADRLMIGVLPADPEARPPHRDLVDALDLTLTGPARDAGRPSVAVPDPEQAFRGLAEAVSRNPQAALVLRDVLRTTPRLPVEAALDVESYAYSTLLGGPEFARWLAARGPRPLPPDVRDPVLVERTPDAGLRITLNRPARRNAYGRQVRDALVDALQIALLDTGVTRVLLEGAGPVFCAGGDLDEFGTAPDLVTAHQIRTRGGAGRLVHRLRDRIEARVHGSCVGAGIEIPAFAGTLAARPDATFRLPEISMGLIPGAGGTVSVPRRIGRWRTLYLALTGTAIGAATAREWGLIDR